MHFSKPRYIINMSDNGELAKHFHESHNLIDDLNVTILQNNIKTAVEIVDYVEEMYNFY